MEVGETETERERFAGREGSRERRREGEVGKKESDKRRGRGREREYEGRRRGKWRG